MTRSKDHVVLLCRWLLMVFCLISLTGCKELSAAAAQNIGQILQNVQSNLPALFKLVVATSYVMGIAFILIGLFRLKKYGQQTVMMMAAANIGEPMIFLFVGVALTWLPSMLNSMTETLWGAQTSSILSYNVSSMGVTWTSVVGPVMKIIQLIGLIAFVRGFALLTRLAGQAQPGTLSKAFLHILGGTMAVNIYATIDVINQTLFGVS